MCERKDAERVVAVKLIPDGRYDIRCVPIFQRSPRIEVGPIFGDGKTGSEVTKPTEATNESIEWFRKYGDA